MTRMTRIFYTSYSAAFLNPRYLRHPRLKNNIPNGTIR